MPTSSIDYSKFISDAGQKWQAAAIRGLFPLELRPGMISFLAGKPNPQTFPFTSISFSIKPVPGDSRTLPSFTLEDADLAESLQYGPTAGMPRLLSWMVELQKQVHSLKDPQEQGWSCAMGSGSQDLIHKAFAALCNPGECALMESPAYAGAFGFLAPMNVKTVEISSDSEGISAEHLASTLESWNSNPATSALPFPRWSIRSSFHNRYFNSPTGSNPTGASSSITRKKNILAIARKHNILIFEDDAYHYLHFDKQHRAPSYLALEHADGGETGRVVRFDTFSKIVASGMRLGVATGPTAILNVINLHTANTNLQVSSTTQAMAFKLFEYWGITGFLEHCDRVAAFYSSQKEIAEAAAHRHLDGIATWTTPVAGMFLWIKLLIAKDEDEGDSAALVSAKAVEAGVLGVPGFAFLPNGGRSSYLRLAFSMVTEESAEEGFRRLAQVIKAERAENGLA